MKKLLLTFLLATGLSIGVAAQYPTSYNSAQSDKALSATSPCNTDGEAFSEFFARFKKDRGFRHKRAMFDIELFKQNGFPPSQAKEAKTSLGFFGDYGQLKVGPFNTDCKTEYGTFYDVTADEVKYIWRVDNRCTDYESGCYVTFRRIERKWYIVYLVMAG